MSSTMDGPDLRALDALLNQEASLKREEEAEKKADQERKIAAFLRTFDAECGLDLREALTEAGAEWTYEPVWGPQMRLTVYRTILRLCRDGAWKLWVGNAPTARSLAASTVRTTLLRALLDARG